MWKNVNVKIIAYEESCMTYFYIINLINQVNAVDDYY
jgi:hypothetical protein